MEKNKSMMITIIVLLLILLGTIIGISVYTFSLLNNANADQPHQLQLSQTLSPDQITTYSIEKPFKTNLLEGGDGQQHVVSVSIGFAIANIDEQENKTLTDTVAANDEMIRSKILRIIRNKTFEELSESDAQDILAYDILAVLQELFNTNLITEVFVIEMYVY